MTSAIIRLAFRHLKYYSNGRVLILSPEIKFPVKIKRPNGRAVRRWRRHDYSYAACMWCVRRGYMTVREEGPRRAFQVTYQGVLFIDQVQYARGQSVPNLYAFVY